MKKILFLLLALLTVNVYANDTIENTNAVSETVKEVSDVIDKAQPMIVKGAESFEQAIKPYVVDMLSGIQNGVDMAKDEIPIILKQYLMFQGFYYGFYVLASLIMIFILRQSFIRYYTISKFRYDNYEDSDGSYNKSDYKIFNKKRYVRYKKGDVTPPQVMIYGGSFLSIIIGIIIFFNVIFDFIKVIFMPKLFLVEKFITMMQ